jgi:phosphate transport system substrate-binding protein
MQQNPNLGGLLKPSSSNSETQTPAASNPPTATSNPVANSPQLEPTGSSFTDVQNVPSGLFNYGGSTTWAPIRRDVDPVIQSSRPEFQLRYTDAINATPGSGTGIRMLLNSQLAFSQSSRPINDKEYQQAQQRGFSLKQLPVALEGLAIAVNPSLSIPGLTLAQVKDIYTGKINNWNQVGGPNLKITPYSRRPEDGGTVEFFVDNVLGGEKLGNNVEYVFSTTQALRVLAANPGGIYYASAPEVVPQCSIKPLPIARQVNNFVSPYQLPLVPPTDCPGRRNQLNTDAFRSGQYPITRQMFVVVKQNGRTDQQAGEAYANMLLTAQGQELIGKAGFVPLR